MLESMTAWVPTGKKPGDLLTKFLYGSKRRNMLGNLLHDIYDENYQLNSRLGRPCCTFHSGAYICKVKSMSISRELEIGGSKLSQTTYLIILEARRYLICTGSYLYGESFVREKNPFRCKESV